MQHLLADTAVYRDTQENLAKKVELLHRQASNDALRALQAEKRCQDADEKLLLLKRQARLRGFDPVVLQLWKQLLHF